MAKSKSNQPKKVYRITLVCRSKKPEDGTTSGVLTTAEKVTTSSFKCPVCGQTIIYLPGENRIVAHGQHKPGTDSNAPPPSHELRKVSEAQAPSPGAKK